MIWVERNVLLQNSYWPRRAYLELARFQSKPGGNPNEMRVRDPMEFIGGLRCPLTLYAGDQTRDVNGALAAKARRLGQECERC